MTLPLTDSALLWTTAAAVGLSFFGFAWMFVDALNEGTGNYATAMFRNEKITDYNCYDIGYRISPSRIFKIHQLELSLQNHKMKK